jgi:hypothetical protein
MLTTAQAQAIKAVILADPALAAQPMNSDGDFAIAAALNLDATPAFVVWKSSVRQDDITQNGFAWAEVDNLTVGKARIWEWLFLNDTRSMNPAKANVRAGIVECWSGTAGKVAVQTAVFSHCKRNASRAEKALATGTGSDATPAVMGYEGALSYQDVSIARAI